MRRLSIAPALAGWGRMLGAVAVHEVGYLWVQGLVLTELFLEPNGVAVGCWVWTASFVAAGGGPVRPVARAGRSRASGGRAEASPAVTGGRPVRQAPLPP